MRCAQDAEATFKSEVEKLQATYEKLSKTKDETIAEVRESTHRVVAGHPQGNSAQAAGCGCTPVDAGWGGHYGKHRAIPCQI